MGAGKGSKQKAKRRKDAREQSIDEDTRDTAWDLAWGSYCRASLVAVVGIAIFAPFLFGPNLDEFTSKSVTGESAAPKKAQKPGTKPSVPTTPRQVAIAAAQQPCTNKDVVKQRCHDFAAGGECKRNPGWMHVYCAASCQACELMDPEVRCNEDRIGGGYKRRAALGPGDLGALFRSLPRRFPEYNISFLAEPPNGPYIAQFDSFISDFEIEALLGHAQGLKRSTDQSEKFDSDGVQVQVTSKSRTSMNAWCLRECAEDPIVKRVSDRIQSITGIPEENYENFQILRYERGQRYNRHHDMSDRDNSMLAGPRVLTFFIYLSDVEAGGGTSFPDLEPRVTMTPKKGSAILWPSVLDDHPTTRDDRTHHEALPVEAGLKFAANHWIHVSSAT